MPFKKGQSGNKNGRPIGSTTKPRISDNLTPEQIESLIEKARDMASKGDTNMLKFILEQHFGKAPQAMDITSGGEKIMGVVVKVQK